MTSDLLNEMLNLFKTHGHAPDLRAEVMALPAKVWLNILEPPTLGWPPTLRYRPEDS